MPASPSASGQLEISPASLDRGTGSSGQIVLTASGGPVSWTAAASSPDLIMSQSSGQLAAGQSVTLVVQVQRTDGAVGSATISINSAAVPVTWDATQPHRHRRQQPGQPAASSPASSWAASGGRPLRELATGGGRSQ